MIEIVVRNCGQVLAVHWRGRTSPERKSSRPSYLRGEKVREK